MKDRTKLVLLAILGFGGFFIGYSVKNEQITNQNEYLKQVTTRLVEDYTRQQVIIQDLDYQVQQCRLLYRGQ